MNRLGKLFKVLPNKLEKVKWTINYWYAYYMPYPKEINTILTLFLILNIPEPLSLAFILLYF